MCNVYTVYSVYSVLLIKLLNNFKIHFQYFVKYWIASIQYRPLNVVVLQRLLCSVYGSLLLVVSKISILHNTQGRHCWTSKIHMNNICERSSLYIAVMNSAHSPTHLRSRRWNLMSKSKDFAILEFHALFNLYSCVRQVISYTYLYRLNNHHHTWILMSTSNLFSIDQ